MFIVYESASQNYPNEYNIWEEQIVAKTHEEQEWIDWMWGNEMLHIIGMYNIFIEAQKICTNLNNKIYI